ncbi:MAG: Uma2 family endonuclease [Myxococcales bacterium]|nr:Uma2 family endonuclease [Myxococcales bacterium]
MSALPRVHISYAEYLAAERVSPVKHAYLRGEIFAMAGGTIEHSRLAANLLGELLKALAGRPCNVFTSDLRVRILATDKSTYPDVTVVSGKVERAPDDTEAAINPILIAEVLSDGTEAEDRGDKFALYRRISSLRDYVLISQKERHIEVYHRDGDHWILSEAGPGAAAQLASLGVALSVEAVYRDPTAE